MTPLHQQERGEIILTDRHIQQFWARVPDAGGMECWLWQGTIARSGYGMFSCGNKQVMPRTRQAHRVSFFLRYGGLPPTGMHLDHLCRNRHCVNPAHLEPVTPKENNLRGNSPTSKIHLKTHCCRGHPFEGRNLVRVKHRSGHIYRGCRQCGLDNAKRTEQQAREKQLEQLIQAQGPLGMTEHCRMKVRMRPWRFCREKVKRDGLCAKHANMMDEYRARRARTHILTEEQQP